MKADNFIVTVDDALPIVNCHSIIQEFEESSLARPGVTGGGVDLNRKRSSDITVDLHPAWSRHLRTLHSCARKVVVEYCKHYHFLLIGALAPAVKTASGNLVGLSNDTWSSVDESLRAKLTWRLYKLGAFTVQKYDCGSGGYPHWHSEIYPQAGAKANEALHRVLFIMFYLNDVVDGGETEFFYQGRRVVPKAGTAVVAPAGFTHTHRGCVPHSGHKYVATSWVVFRSAEELYGEPLPT